MMQKLMVKIQNGIVSILDDIILAVEFSAAKAVTGLRAAARGVKRFF